MLRNRSLLAQYSKTNRKAGKTESEPLLEQATLVPKEKALKIWEECRATFHLPVIKDPALEKPPFPFSGMHFDFASGRPYIDPAFAFRLSQNSGIDLDLVLAGMMTGVIGSYMNFPRNYQNIMLLQHYIHENAGDSHGIAFAEAAFRKLSRLINDANNAICPQRSRFVLCLRKAEAIASKDEFASLILAYLEKQAGETGASEKEHAPFLERLFCIDFKNAPFEPRALENAAVVFLEVMRNFWGERYFSRSFGIGKGRFSLGEAYEGKMEPIDSDATEMIRKARRADIDIALSKIAPFASKEELERITKRAGIEIEGGEGKGELMNPFLGAGTSGGGLWVKRQTVEYYLKLIENYPAVAGKPAKEILAEQKRMSGTDRFFLGNPMERALPETSGGKVLPGITMMVGEAPRVFRKTDYAPENSLIIQDASLTMGDPEKSTSVLAAIAVGIAKTTIQLGGKVGVINFGSKTYCLPYTCDLRLACAAILAYQGGGTLIDTAMGRLMLKKNSGMQARLEAPFNSGNLQSLLENVVFAKKHAQEAAIGNGLSENFSEKDLHVYLVSDMKIHNKRKMLELLEELKEANSVAVITSAPAWEVGIETSGKLTVYHSVKDISEGARIIIQEAEKGMRQQLAKGKR
ncbi:MAG: hypothetical protein N3G22_00590 [Candidatus Micrarchaeota archaeon]|nr:hypothetical protein [Candidatus Micrarchaeota archaeon]